MTRFISLLLLLLPVCLFAQTGPRVNPQGLYITENTDGTADTTDINGTTQNAPLKVQFKANPSGLEGYGTPRYEWKIWNAEDPMNILVHRSEENMEYTFNATGSFSAQLYVTFYNADGSVYYEFPEEGEDPMTITVTISESKLDFPNAISPNNDSKNDWLQPKEPPQSIISFQAAVFNRWGTKLYSWSDPNGHWDGTYAGKRVKDGVYFLVVKAKGADGRNYNIKKTISVISGYNNGENEAAGDE